MADKKNDSYCIATACRISERNAIHFRISYPSKGIIDVVRKGRVWKTNKKTIDSYIGNHGRKKVVLV